MRLYILHTLTYWMLISFWALSKLLLRLNQQIKSERGSWNISETAIFESILINTDCDVYNNNEQSFITQMNELAKETFQFRSNLAKAAWSSFTKVQCIPIQEIAVCSFKLSDGHDTSHNPYINRLKFDRVFNLIETAPLPNPASQIRKGTRVILRNGDFRIYLYQDWFLTSITIMINHHIHQWTN